MLRVIAALTLATMALVGPAHAGGSAEIAWRDWSDDAFATAAREKRLVLLDLGAVWCHWCHVMDETTYRDPRVVKLLREHYVAVKVDQDARPDLSNRYEEYGWPATVIFAADGSELVKFQGYIPPERMASLLQGVVDDPTPGPSVTGAAEPRAAAAALPADALQQELERLLADRYDTEQGGWGFSHKFLDWDAVEYSLERAREGDAASAQRARETLQKQLKLIDPVWGGVYQYSDSGVWENPHFEKIMSMQAENLRVYAQAYLLWAEPAHLQAARDIARYLDAFLSDPGGAFYVSQDADVVRGQHSAGYFALDDAGRRGQGLPRVDTHRYARETAWAGQALVWLGLATGEAAPLERARRAARFLLAERALPEGGFRHDAQQGGLYLGDTLAAGRLFLLLHAATAEREWLERAQAAARFLAARFVKPGQAGVITAAPGGAFDRPAPQRDENVAVARFANLLFHYTGAAEHRALAEAALSWLRQPEVARRPQTGGVLLALREAGRDPVHVTVVGPRGGAGTGTLLRAALADASAYRRVDLWDRSEGRPAPGGVSFPELKQPAAFVCADGRCSRPAYTPEELKTRLARFR